MHDGALYKHPLYDKVCPFDIGAIIDVLLNSSLA